jgi:hypothetical protein
MKLEDLILYSPGSIPKDNRANILTLLGLPEAVG